MQFFKETSHLSEILEESKRAPVVIFIFSSTCGSSSRLEKEIEDKFFGKKFDLIFYKVTVQKQPVLSEKIAEWFRIKHESPQIIAIDDGKVVYTEHHKAIDLEKIYIKKTT
jgi:bacillithiol system protein YtxJ